MFNQTLKRVALFDYPDRKKAEKMAAELTAGGKSPHFVQLVKDVGRRNDDARMTNDELLRSSFGFRHSSFPNAAAIFSLVAGRSLNSSLPKPRSRAGSDGRVLMLRVVRDEHHGHVRQFRMAPDRSENLDAVGIVFVELAVDEDQVEVAVAEQGERIVAGSGLLDFDAVVNWRRRSGGSWRDRDHTGRRRALAWA